MKRIFTGDWDKFEGKFDKKNYRMLYNKAKRNAWMSFAALLIVFALYMFLILNV